jgi:trigger factor
MNVTETTNEGLNRVWRVVVPATEIGANIDRRLNEISKTVKMPGFRPGKVPLGMLKKRYGASVMGEVLEKTVQDSSAKVLEEQAVRPALEPKIEVVNFADGADLEYTIAVETLPDVEPADLTDLALERPVVAVDDAAVDEAVNRIAKNSRNFEPVEPARPAETGDQLLIDFAGSVDGEARPGMAGQDQAIELGAGNFIPGFEEQLVGANPGETRTVAVSFPEGYHAADLAGKAAVFEVTVKEVRAPVESVIDDALAKRLGVDDVESLRKTVRQQIEGEYGRLMVDLEFDSIWKQLQTELSPEERSKPEDELKADYRQIAERRVRLGLLLSEIGKRNDIQVTQQEVNAGLIAEARRYPGQEREVIEAYRKNPRLLDTLRAPIYEDKVVDHILGAITLNDRTVTAEELARDDDDEQPSES